MTEKIFYSAPGARTGDVIPKYIDGKYQLFYLKGWKEPVPDGAVRGWHRMESEDLIHMGKEVPIHVQGGTGDLIFAEGKWHLFACIFPDGKQYITHYVSRDGSLDHWEYQEEDTFGPDGVIYQGPDWRDPRIEYDPETEEYRMILAARAKDGHSQTGCVGLCVSRDLKHWEYREPLYYPRRFNGACECPDIFRIGGWEYLIFSSYTNLFGTYYVKRRTGESHFQIPRNHRLDARGFYAAKTAGNETERYLFGWCPTKEENIFGFWPDGLKAQDYRTWDWGGEMVIHQLVQHPDGDLGLSLPRTRRELFAMPEENTFRKITDGWEPLSPYGSDPRGLAVIRRRYAADDADAAAFGNRSDHGADPDGRGNAGGRCPEDRAGNEGRILSVCGAGPGAAGISFLASDVGRRGKDLSL